MIALHDYDFEVFSIYDVLSIPCGIFKLYINILKFFETHALDFLEMMCHHAPIVSYMYTWF